MAKFCTKCGKKLEECTCEKNTKEVVTETTVSDKFDFNEYVNSYVDMIKGIFTKPVDTIKKFASAGNFKLGLIAILLNCIIVGIFTYCFCSESLDSITSLFGGFSGFGFDVEVPFMRTFLYALFSSAVQFTVVGLMIYFIAGVIFKDKIDMKKIFALIGVCSVFTTITTLVAIVCVYISFTLAIVVLLLAGLFYTIYLFQGVSEISNVDKNKLGFVYVPAIAVAAFVVVYVLPKILS